MNVLGYARCSTQEQQDSGHGLDAQEQRIRETCSQRDWTLVEIVREQGSGKDLGRPVLLELLQRLADGEAEALVVSKVDRLTRSILDFAMLVNWFVEGRLSLVVLDLDLDMSTPTGEAMAHMLAVFAQLERRMISERTKNALAARRAAGLTSRSVSDRPELVARIRELRAEGLSYDRIAGVLNSEGWSTCRGAACWRGSAIPAALGYTRKQPRRRAALLPSLERRC